MSLLLIRYVGVTMMDMLEGVVSIKQKPVT